MSEFPADLARGDWLVVLYRPDCAHCQQLIPELTEHFADIQAADGVPPALALIDLSSQANAEWRIPGRIGFGRLSTDWQWFVTPPVSIGLHNGRVNNVRSGRSGVNLTGSSITDALGLPARWRSGQRGHES